MNCPTCGCCAKENMANFKKFYFCGECRKEVTEETNTKFRLPYDDEEFDLGSLTPEERAEFEAWMDQVKQQADDDFDFFFP
jgi:hypothetical protein